MHNLEVATCCMSLESIPNPTIIVPCHDRLAWDVLTGERALEGGQHESCRQAMRAVPRGRAADGTIACGSDAGGARAGLAVERRGALGESLSVQELRPSDRILQQGRRDRGEGRAPPGPARGLGEVQGRDLDP